ncbi:MAG TPA: CopG family transcriptional regulator [Blastocatellia bacterium]|nr:CopG family transcriptional regulator [Blastocatellia bacterium]
MNEAITVTLPEEIRLALQEATHEEKLSESELIEKALSDYLFVRKFRILRERMMKTAQKEYTDQDIFDLVS